MGHNLTINQCKKHALSRSKKQKVVALSSAEAEFRGIKSGLTEVLWLRRLMGELGFPLKQSCRLFCDNKAPISISENPVQYDRTKHVEVDRHFIKEKIECGILELPFVPSDDQLADILTKVVGSKSFGEILDKLSFGNPIYNSTIYENLSFLTCRTCDFWNSSFIVM